MNQKSIQWLSAKAHIRFVNQSNKNQEYRRGCRKASSFSFSLSTNKHIKERFFLLLLQLYCIDLMRQQHKVSLENLKTSFNYHSPNSAKSHRKKRQNIQ